MSTRVLLETIYHEVARRTLLRQQPEDIAKATGLHLVTLHHMLRRDEFKTILEDLRTKHWAGFDEAQTEQKRDLRVEIETAGVECFDRLMSLLRSTANENLITNIGQDILDRAGFKGVKGAEDGVHIHIHPTDASVIKEALDKEKEGAELLEKKQPELAKLSKDLHEHPLHERLAASERPEAKES